MNWDDLRFVLAVARAGSLTGAARTLEVTHTTVARRLKGLEAQMGSRLFDQMPDGFVLTDVGRSVLPIAERMEEQALGLDRALLGRETALEGQLRVATVDFLAIWFSEAIASFAEAYPAIELILDVDVRPTDLARREAEVALRITVGSPPEHLVGRKVGRMEYAIYASRSLFERIGPDADLADFPWLTWPEESNASITKAWFKRHVPNARVALRSDAGMVLQKFLEDGAGIMHSPCITADRNPDLVRLTPVEPGFGMDMWLLTHPDLRQTGRVRAFIRHMGDTIVAQRSAFLGQDGAPPALRNYPQPDTDEKEPL